MRISCFGVELVVILRRKLPYRMVPYRNPEETRVTDASEEECFGQILVRVFLPYDRKTGKMQPRFSIPYVVAMDDDERIINYRSSYTLADRKSLHDAIDYACRFIERIKKF